MTRHIRELHRMFPNVSITKTRGGHFVAYSWLLHHPTPLLHQHQSAGHRVHEGALDQHQPQMMTLTTTQETYAATEKGLKSWV